MPDLPVYLAGGGIRCWTVVDADVWEWAAQLRWCAHKAAEPYPKRNLGGGRTEFLHRRIMGLAPGDPRRVDHINGDRLDNRRVNLRIATTAQNAQNQGARAGTSRSRGVSWDKSKSRWYAQAQVDGTKHNLGRFRTEEEAARAVAAFRAERMPYSEEARAA